MAQEQSTPSLADYVVTALSPALIMGLVGSLVFFLLEVFYVGQYPAQLQWGLFFFVFAAVLIARLSIQGGTASRAPLYAVALAIPVWLTLQFFVDIPEDNPAAPWKWLINLALMGVTWWCAHKLTWDCTHLDEDAEGNQGLLAATGLEQSTAAEEVEEKEEPDKPLSWWERYQQYQEERRKKHTPGTWVIWFSLAALPLFGLGQSLIPAEEEGRRQYAFWLTVFYVGCGLGLLLTTCFLGLRRYLRQRDLKMPMKMTGIWLGSGVVLILVLLTVGAILPRPNAEYPILDVAYLKSTDREASWWSPHERGGGKGKGKPSAEQRDDGQEVGKKPPTQGSGREPGSKDQGPGGTGKSNGNGTSKSSDGGGTSKSSDGNQKSGTGKQPGDDRGTAKGERKEGQQKPGEKKSGEPESKQNEGQQNSENQSRGSTWASIQRFLATLAPILKWIVFAALAVLVGFVLFRAFLQFLANFSSWAKALLDALQALWNGLFGWWERKETAGESEAAAERTVKPKPFASFANPFTTGQADGMSTAALVRYSFEALEAWAYERDMGRTPDETPLEFAERLGEEVPTIETEAEHLAVLYARLLYSQGGLPGNARADVEQFWDRLEAVMAQPLSA